MEWAWFFSTQYQDTQSGHRNIRLLRSHRQKYSYTNTPLRKAVKAHLLLSVEKCNLKTKTKKQPGEKTVVKVSRLLGTMGMFIK